VSGKHTSYPQVKKVNTKQELSAGFYIHDSLFTIHGYLLMNTEKNQDVRQLSLPALHYAIKLHEVCIPVFKIAML